MNIDKKGVAVGPIAAAGKEGSPGPSSDRTSRVVVLRLAAPVTLASNLRKLLLKMVLGRLLDLDDRLLPQESGVRPQRSIGVPWTHSFTK